MFKDIIERRKSRQTVQIKQQPDQGEESRLKESINNAVYVQNKNVEQIFFLQKKIQKEMNEFKEQVQVQQQISQQQIAMLDELENTLKEFGDFQNFLQSLQQQAEDIVVSLQAKALKS
eukprot:TRINITY_DN5962_c1_g1_i1.p5 TRINITY_DN5962_c1_g1~~TRINITY_DN5962_c1_g1_i1.p5  ORF type:complete len:118 (-),score=18.57 TRINITY_DN5962_c1_g1_i1:554-907(-)